MIVHPETQGSLEWGMRRCGIPTASEFDNLVTPQFEIRKGEMPKTYLYKKLAEAWMGAPMLGVNSFDTEMGSILEDEAKPWYELEYGVSIQRVGFITTDDGKCGCSPDGMIGDVGVEIKCPAPHTHVGYLVKGALPKEYAAQVHGSMFVTGASTWKFVSYRRHFPALVIEVQRDHEIQSAIRQAISEFSMAFDFEMKHLEELNGGPPKRNKPIPFCKQDFVSEMPS
jgi:hypothetical protein